MLSFLPLLLLMIILHVYLVCVYNSLVLFIRHDAHGCLEFAVRFYGVSVHQLYLPRLCSHFSSYLKRFYLLAVPSKFL